MTFIITVLVILAIALLGITYLSRWRARRYEQKGITETLSPSMRAALERERRENRAKKRQFEETLKEAEQTRLKTKPS